MTPRNHRTTEQEAQHMSTDRTGISRRGFLAVGGGVAAGAALTACGGGKSADDVAGGGTSSGSKFTGKYTGPAVTLSYWNGFTGGDGPSMDKLVEEFQQANPKITIKQNTIQWADFYQKVPAAVTANKGPDVGVMHQDQLATNAARKVIVPVDDVAKALGLQESDFSPEVWKAGIYQGKRYGIPLDVHSLGMYLRKDDADKAGITTAPADAASFQQTLDALKSKAGQEQPFWMPTKWPAHLMFLSLLWQFGGEPYAEDGSKATFDSDAGVKGLTWMVDQIKKGYSPKNVAIDTQYVGFKNNKLAVTWDGIWQINDLKGADVPFMLAPIPTIGDQAAVWANSHHFFITRQSTQDDNKFDASRVFIDWMSNKSAEWAGSGLIPARKSVQEDTQVTDSAQGPVAKTIPSMRFLPPVPGLGDVQAQTLEIAVNEATLMKRSPADALKDAATKASSAMQDNLKKYGA
jgi:multiple sugar transport system substrate-binding protein